jgi:NAD(P)-dependent dehydrogenase (short-subunit alcohol dehydrogenase family)
MGALRALVNSTGVGRAAGTLDRNNDPMPQATFDLVSRVNLLGTFTMLPLGAVAMGKTEPIDADGSRGAIVNIASVAVFDGQIGQAPYEASRAGLSV